MEFGQDIPADVLTQAVESVLRGGILLYPTDTVYGIGGDAARDDVTRRIRELKGVEANKPLLVLTDSWDRVEDWIPKPEGLVRRLMALSAFHSITILFPAAERVPRTLIGSSEEIGIRLCRHPFCIDLIRKASRPISSTSANPTGEAVPLSMQEINDRIRLGVDLVVDGGSLPGAPSTIVRPVGDRPIVLREGSISEAALGRLLEGQF